ncbi:hypothetical protein BRC62_06270 [Halobacteriales archaeon QH_10_67_13]|nr:MAG: hypothetical protein BRC62_06270 [Halobacteriales archaeon QH_10_67_13]
MAPLRNGWPDSLSERGVRLAAIALAVVATATIAAFAAGVGGTGIAGSPIDRALPGEQYVGQADTDGLDNVTGGADGGLGALNPRTQTGVGGELGFDKETFASNDTSVHFTVEAPRPAYWRTGAYDTYTGVGWQRPGETDPYNGPLGVDGSPGERIEYEITLARGATSLPTAWRPESVAAEGLEVTDQRAIRTASPVPTGTTYSGTSVLAPQDPAVLQASEGSVPERLRERYTQLPADTPDRVGERTARIVDGSDTTYDAVAAVEEWLRTEKNYSLRADRESESIADTFIFEMEAGYCEYFATAMTTMLRTQDIPARYVVGYTSGEQTGTGEYAVRGQNAHAWVEVYFPEVGWVPFDPTPPADRIATEQANLGDDPAPESATTPDQADPTDAPEPPEGDPPDDGPDPDNGTDETPAIDISLNETAVPGRTVAVTVTRDESPVVEEIVRFNGEPIGRTDRNGTVVGTVPYADELEITVEETETAAVGASVGGSTGVARGDAGRSHAIGAVGGTFVRAVGETVPLETNATVTVAGDPRPGEAVTILATVSGTPVPEATVTVNGEAVATTDGDGRATVTLPERSGQVAIAVERGAVAGEQIVDLPALSVAVDPELPVALPFGSATVTVTADGEPVPDAAVAIGGETVARTGPDGTATIRLPASNDIVVGSRYGLSAAAELSGQLRNAAAGLVVALGVGALGAIGWSRRSGVAVRARDRLSTAAQRTASGLRQGLIGAAAAVDGAVGRGASGLGRTGSAGVFSRLHTEVRARWRSVLRADDERPDQTRQAPSPEDPEAVVRASWARLLEEVSLRERRTRTPEELAAHAIEVEGLPRRPVETLRDAFRAVEYGARPPAERVERVRQAITAIEAAAGDAEGT